MKKNSGNKNGKGKAKGGKIGIKNGQVWTIGNMIKNFIEEDYKVRIGNTVKIIDAFVGDSLITVCDVKSNFQFNLKSLHLGSFLYLEV